MLVSGVLMLRDRRVKRVGLPAAGRAGHEHHPPRALNGGLELDERLGLEAEFRHVEHELVLVEETHDDLLAEERRQHGHAEVDFFRRTVLGEPDLDAAVLRQPLLRDVELGHDLDARDDGVAKLHRRVHDVVENPVNAVANAELPFVRLDVDVARPLLDGGHQHDIDETDDGRFLALAAPGLRR